MAEARFEEPYPGGSGQSSRSQETRTPHVGRRMKFAFAGIDFLGGVFEALVGAGWTPIKLFTRPCDGIYDHNEAVLASARRHRVPMQISRMKPEDLAALAEVQGRDWALVVAGYPWLVRGWRGAAAYGLNFHPSPLPMGRGPYPCSRRSATGSPNGA